MADKHPTISVRLHPGVIDRLDAWVDEVNRQRRDDPTTRPELLRALLTWASRTRPDCFVAPEDRGTLYNILEEE